MIVETVSHHLLFYMIIVPFHHINKHIYSYSTVALGKRCSSSPTNPPIKLSVITKNFNPLHWVKNVCRELWTNRTPQIYKCIHTHSHTSRSWVIGGEEWLSERWMDETMKINELCMCVCVCARERHVASIQVYMTDEELQQKCVCLRTRVCLCVCEWKRKNRAWKYGGRVSLLTCFSF